MERESGFRDNSDPRQQQGGNSSKRGWRGNNRGRGGRGGSRGGGYRNDISAPGSSRENNSRSGGGWRQRPDRGGGWQEDERDRSGTPALNNPEDVPFSNNHRRDFGFRNQNNYRGGGNKQGRGNYYRGGRGGGHQQMCDPNDRSTAGTLNPMAAPFIPGENGELVNEILEDEIGSSGLPAGYQGEGGKIHNNNRSPYKKKGRNFNREKQKTEGTFRDGIQFNQSEDVEDKWKSTQEKPRNQREVLMDQLSRSIYECMVCCEKVRASQPIWSCKRCFNVFHLHCIRKWATSSEDENGWRCPGCQSYSDITPKDYYCFCEKTKNPKTSKYDTPHTCGQTCGKPNPGGMYCTHKCITQCHPGPCPSCEVQQKRFCGCGKTNAQVLCGSKTVLSCDSVCNKSLNCGAHRCTRKCHPGECDDCEEKITHLCHCSSKQKIVECTKQNNECKTYSCAGDCNKPLRCGSHRCDSVCHSGSCGPCKTSVEAVMSCPCGQTSIAEACKATRMTMRKKCTDPIPVCGKICQKILPCGGIHAKHHCQHKCHLEPVCPPCGSTSSVKCRCGTKIIDILCKELKNGEEITCQKKCNKKKSCGKHKCNSKCCIDIDHICTIVCQRQLRCGIHNCTNLCHLNPCPPCGIVSFDELSCECGASVIYPPVPCGTRRPPCQLPCSRQHSCDHPVHHPCHSEENCPPCSVLTEKWCHGKHELRKNVMCHIKQLSCGLPCGKQLSCSRHVCPKTCHAGPCLENQVICKLPCDKLKPCGHKCGAPCHDGECPETKCKIMTTVNCPCGRKTDTLVCYKRDNEYDKTITWEYHKELKRLEEEAKAKEELFEIDDIVKATIMEEMKEKIPISNVLECDKECARIERNRKLAEALQVENADVTTSIGTPNYSDFLTLFAKKNPQFIEMVHKQLVDLVMKAKQSRKKNETYAFNSMNRDKRHVIHEYSDHFGILSESFDEEPNRNVICFASKEKCYLPSVTLIDAVFRPTVRSERLKPHDDVSFHPDKRSQIVGPSNWATKPKLRPTEGPHLSVMNISGSSSQSSDFPPL